MCEVTLAKPWVIRHIPFEKTTQDSPHGPLRSGSFQVIRMCATSETSSRPPHVLCGGNLSRIYLISIMNLTQSVIHQGAPT
jgi:hypothetical protein